jgi:hypothetical protein
MRIAETSYLLLQIHYLVCVSGFFSCSKHNFVPMEVNSNNLNLKFDINVEYEF